MFQIAIYMCEITEKNCTIEPLAAKRGNTGGILEGEDYEEANVCVVFQRSNTM